MDANDESSINRLIFKIQHNGKKKIVRQSLKDHCKGEASIFKSIADSLMKTNFPMLSHAMKIDNIFDKKSIFNFSIRRVTQHLFSKVEASSFKMNPGAKLFQ